MPIPPWTDRQPPLNPVLAPIAVTGMFSFCANNKILATWSVEEGLTKTSGGKTKFSVWSFPYSFNVIGSYVT